ncbi:hypothetical protein [Sunxiuqinia indica]|uniref:hypothetical protein n=1 Tax=Sunxiuqinia indica TaxID=2692584 RepID=UPI00135A17A1|nr:hypothetical protein [Sunxiuqinia indica]
MDAIIYKAARIVYFLNIRIKRFFHRRIFHSQTSMFVFILAFTFSVGLIGLSGAGFSIQKATVSSAVLTLALFFILFSIGVFKESKRMQENELCSFFHFSRSNMNGIKLQQLGFLESDRDKLNLLLNNQQPNSKIDFLLISDNRMAADYKKLFRILHLLIEGGIVHFKKAQKEKLFRLIESTFTLNGSEVNRASLNSRFSEWVNEKETEFSENLEPFRKILKR